MEKDDKLYKIVNIDGVDYRIEIEDQEFPDKIYYKVELDNETIVLFCDDPEKGLKEIFESRKYWEQFDKSKSESESENKFVIKDVKNLKLNNFRIIDENGNEKVINKEFKDVKELTLDDLLNLSDN